MKLKHIILLLATGLCTGVVMASSFGQLSIRTAAMGGEIFFLPMVGLLVWLGWMLHGETAILRSGKRRNGSGCSRKR